ncbi:hypothetical protein BGX34_003067, partial [Mortierella sp. NVP85]
MTITILREAPSTTEAVIRHTQENVTLHITPVSNLVQHPGTLYVAQECLYFFSPASNNTGFAIPYSSIIIHAIARESRVGPSIYCQLEGSLPSSTSSGSGGAANGHASSNGNAAGEKDDDHEEDDMDEDAVLEMSFAPADVSSLDTIFEHLSYCASLHQDEDDGDDYDMDGEGDYDYDEEDDEQPFLDDVVQGRGSGLGSSSATTIGVASSTSASSVSGTAVLSTSSTEIETEVDGVESMPAIDLDNGEWYTGNPVTDAKFELSEQGQ